MDRVEREVLPPTSDPLAFKASFSSDFTMISVTAAIIAQVAITALALPNLNQLHWIATAGFVMSLVMGCMSVWVSTTASRRLSSLDSPDAVRNWLSKPASINSRFQFEQQLKARFKTSDLSSREELQSIHRSISTFVEENKWKIPSSFSCTMLTVPSLFLNMSLPSFLIALGIYLGTVWKENLDPVAGAVASRAVLICYIVCLIAALALLFGASNQKEAEKDFLIRWSSDLERRAQLIPSADDVEARSSSGNDIKTGNSVTQGLQTIQRKEGHLGSSSAV